MTAKKTKGKCELHEIYYKILCVTSYLLQHQCAQFKKPEQDEMYHSLVTLASEVLHLTLIKMKDAAPPVGQLVYY